MHSTIVAITQPLIETLDGKKLTAEEFIVYCARVSNPDNQLNLDTAPKLIRYLIKNKHWSPFEMVNIVISVDGPRDITRQLLRHDMHFQEFSQRYAQATGFTNREARAQDPKNRQKSLELNSEDFRIKWFHDVQQEILDLIQERYVDALGQGIAKEQARVLLPEGLTMSRLYANGTLRNWIHYCQVRMDKSTTQKEHVELASMCWEQLKLEFPNVHEALQ